ncbi:MAG TPA: hypothetical protein VNW29_00550 [Candidatus Sulfotelmatobacter sp.]|jgi:hypothetical protein|nr:hypothetical protein [Candidatus Sulfotelmatobacter sp.]
MPGKEQEYRPGGELLRKTEKAQTKWYRKFVGSLAPFWAEYGLTQTQIPTIRGLIATIVSNTSNPGKIIDPIITLSEEKKDLTFGVDLWEGLDSLMRATEQVTGERHRYTPHEFIASLRGFSNIKVLDYLHVDGERRAAHEHTIEFGLSLDQKERLKGSIDQVVEDPDFFERQTRLMGPEYSVYPYRYDGYYWRERQEQHITEQREFLVSLTEQDRNRINGMTRFFPTCMFQSEYIIDHLPKIEPDLDFLYAEGFIMPSLGAEGHHIVLAVPDSDTKEAALDMQHNVIGYPLLTTAGDNISEVPSMSSITVIDPSILQLFTIPFLEDLKPTDRISFAQLIAPVSFSRTGVFVDSYAKYVQFLGLIGSFDPDFHVSTDSFSRIFARRK